MKTSSPYYHLKFIVQAKKTTTFFEPIAAFDHEAVARDYAELCARTSPLAEYRVMQRDKGDQLKQIYPVLVK